MRNFYEIVRDSLEFNKFHLNDSVCVEYTCPLPDNELPICSQLDYVVYVLSGKKSWRTIHGTWAIEQGDILYIKRGATIVRQFFDDEFCVLGFFINEKLIQDVLNELDPNLYKSIKATTDFSCAKLKPDHYLDAFFQSILPYFQHKEQPMESLVKLKLKELITLLSANKNQELLGHFKSIISQQHSSIPTIMETNFCYNMSLEEFAKMCHRSLSSFKRDFFNHYQTTPGKWLLAKRLAYAGELLLKENASITQVAFDCGFEDVSHFTRVFKEKYDRTPSEFRKQPA